MVMQALSSGEYSEVLGHLGESSEIGKGLRRILDGELSMPNIPFQTMGGLVFWNNIAECNGYRLQQNMITQHARILDPDDVRIAWGTISGMTRAMERMVRYVREAENERKSQSFDAIDKLKRLKELLDLGAITQAEFDSKKSDLMTRI